jgi:hypothetical protein
MTLTDHERRVLDFLADEHGDYGFYSFAEIMAGAGIADRGAVRTACRSLTDKGLATWAAGLWSDDGEPAGSGYGATLAGVIAVYGPR